MNKYKLLGIDFGNLAKRKMHADKQALEVAVSSLENAKHAVELVDGTHDIASKITSAIADVEKRRLELGSEKRE